MTISEAARQLRAGKVSAVELTRASLASIERLDPEINAFLEVLREHALRRAAQADSELAAGHDRGRLHGIPVAVKDLFHMRGVRTTGGSRIHEGVAAIDAAAVEKLEDAGAVIVGKLNLHELAYGITSENPHFGPVRNPWNREHICGGSSGGSGAAVAAGMVFASLGTDTGGSIRIPASFCGVAGFKPTYGLVSRHGVLPLGFSLDHVGPLARTVRDAALVLDVIAEQDQRDFVPEERCSIRGMRIGFAKALLEHVSEEVAAALQDLEARARALGAKVASIEFPHFEELNTIGQVILLSEAAAVYEQFLDRPERFGADVRALLEQGRLVPATDYINAQRLRRQFEADFQAVWNEADCLLLPATSITAPRLGEAMVLLRNQTVPVRRAATRFTRPLNVLGLPSLVLPYGRGAAGLPIGVQICGPAFHDAVVLRVGAALEDLGITIS